MNESEIPTDYGGTNISSKEAFAKEASDPPLLKRQEIELLHVKRKGKASIQWDIVLNTEERMEVRVFRRSSSGGACVTVVFGTKIVGEANARCQWGQPLLEDDGSSLNATTTVLPQSTTLIVGNLTGPEKVVIEMDDLEDIVPSNRKVNGKLPRYYFLVVRSIQENK